MNTLFRTCVVSLLMAGSLAPFASSVSAATVVGDHALSADLGDHAAVAPAHASSDVTADEGVIASPDEVKTGQNRMVHEVRVSSYSPPIVVISR